MTKEISSIVENNTLKLVDLPAGHQPIELKWVYKLKKDASGQIVKHKAKLVAKWYVQGEGIGFDEFFAPVARLDLVRLKDRRRRPEGGGVNGSQSKFLCKNWTMS
jgi:hypothetical protein